MCRQSWRRFNIIWIDWRNHGILLNIFVNSWTDFSSLNSSPASIRSKKSIWVKLFAYSNASFLLSGNDLNIVSFKYNFWLLDEHVFFIISTLEKGSFWNSHFVFVPNCICFSWNQFSFTSKMLKAKTTFLCSVVQLAIEVLSFVLVAQLRSHYKRYCT